MEATARPHEQAVAAEGSQTEFGSKRTAPDKRDHSSSKRQNGLPDTFYRQQIEQCRLPENAFTLDFMSDYLTMMDMLAKSITHELHDTCDLTPLQYRILLRMLSPEPALAKQLSNDLGVCMSTISVAISKLAEKHLVCRKESATDMRSIELSLTKPGRKIVEQADEAMLRTMSEYWNSLTREQLEAAITSSLSAVSRHSYPRLENGEPRLDTALVDTVMISRMLTSQALQEVGMTTSDYRILLALKVMGDRCATADIAKFLFLHSSDITGCLKNLEARGFITRFRLDENRRKRMVCLTELGEEMLYNLLPTVFDALHETCHSSDDLIKIHISAARDLVARMRHRYAFPSC